MQDSLPCKVALGSAFLCSCAALYDTVTPERNLLPPEQRGYSPQRPTAAGTAAHINADTGNTVPQRANPTQTAYAHPRRRAQALHIGQCISSYTQLGLYRILSYFKAFVNEPIIMLLPPPTCNDHTLPLQYSIARVPRKIRPSPDPPFVCYTPYNIGNGNIL